MNKIQIQFASIVVVLVSVCAEASPMASVARSVIPSDVHQLIEVDYRTAKRFDWAMNLKAQVSPDYLKAFEIALNDVGVNPDRDVDSLTLASFDGRTPDLSKPDLSKLDLNRVAIVSGSFSSMSVLTQVGLKKIAPIKSNASDLYPLTKKISLAVLDDHTLLLGSDDGIRTMLNVRDGRVANVDSNPQLVEMIKAVERATVWSVLDQRGTQNMLLSALGDAGDLINFSQVKNHVLGSWYVLNFRDGIKFDTLVFASDKETAVSVAALLKAGVLYKKVTANPEQRAALENVEVSSDRLPVVPNPKLVISDRPYLKIEFKANREQLQNLLRSHCFTAMSSERKEWSGITSTPPVDLQ